MSRIQDAIHPLPHLYRNLLLRLILGGALTAMVAGALAFWAEAKRLDALVAEFATDQALHLVHSLRGLPAGHGGGSGDGRGFLIARLDLPNKPAVEIRQPSLPLALADLFQRGLAQPGKDFHENLHLGGQVYMLVSMPVETEEGNGRFTGLYLVGRVLADQLNDRTLWSTLGVIAVVIATTAVLIPVIMALEGRIVRYACDAVDGNIDTLAVLGSAIAKRDSDTDAHNYRVTLMAVRLGEAVGLDARAMRKLIIGAFLHDVGKIAIPDSILLKRGRLTEEEFVVMKTHVNHGLDIVSASRWLSVAIDVVGGHHERFDGSGYPKGLHGSDIPQLARIFAVVDVFDALTSRRPYKEALSCDEACRYLAESRGSHFDPPLVDQFLNSVTPTWRELIELSTDAQHEALKSAVYVYFPRAAREMAVA